MAQLVYIYLKKFFQTFPTLLPTPFQGQLSSSEWTFTTSSPLNSFYNIDLDFSYLHPGHFIPCSPYTTNTAGAAYAYIINLFL